MVIRNVRAEDKAALAALHKASIQCLCGSVYEPELLQSWLEGIRPEIYDHALKHLFFIVADGREKLLGFGMLDNEEAMIDALYVDPDHVKKGVGTRLLQALERLAVRSGLQKVGVFSTLNAQAFYSRRGFEFVRKATHTLANGTSLSCVKMEKTFDDDEE